MKPLVPKKYLKLYKEVGIRRVLTVLFRFPEKEFSLSDLARESGVSKANIGNILQELYRLEIINIEKLSKIWRIRANQKSWRFIKSKIVYNLNVIYQSELIEFLVDYYNNPKSITLFGSFRNGEDISSSDIDLAIESNDIAEYRTLRLEELLEFEKAIGRKIQIHLFNRKSISIELFNNIANGIRVFGFLEVRPYE